MVRRAVSWSRLGEPLDGRDAPEDTPHLRLSSALGSAISAEDLVGRDLECEREPSQHLGVQPERAALVARDERLDEARFSASSIRVKPRSLRTRESLPRGFLPEVHDERRAAALGYSRWHSSLST